MNEFEYYVDMLNIDLAEASSRALVKNEIGAKTAAKEMIGEEVIKRWKLFEKEDGFLSYEKVTDKDMQKKGVDFVVHTTHGDVYYDLKALIGFSYKMDPHEDYSVTPIFEVMKTAAVVELYQGTEIKKENRTMTRDKWTDKMIFVVCDKDGISYTVADYLDIVKLADRYYSLSEKYEGNHITNQDDIDAWDITTYRVRKSNNKKCPGFFIKYPDWGSTSLWKKVERHIIH